ncbi:MAG: hypothetical protein WAR79_12545 [Melioribacteraceae bacterium]
MFRKNLILLFVLLTNLSIAQYYQERTTEHNFESSSLFFSSHFLNPYGMKDIKQLSVGLIDDPFLNAYLNPAILPKIENGSTKIYLDFRGDRTEETIVSSCAVPIYYDAASYIRAPYPDYRYISTTRSEPEPIVSLGIITYPIESLKNKFYVGGTFQYIKSKDDFYSTQFNIYTNNYYYDSFGASVRNSAESVPVIDRYSGSDEMIFTGKLLTLFSGLNLLENLNVGLFFNTIGYERNGSYLYDYKDDYGNLDNNISESKDLKSREQNYSHNDLALGLQYSFDDFSVGIKGGYLDGDVDQLHNSESKYIYQYQTPNVTENWSYNYSIYSSTQNWNQEGDTKYFSLNFSKNFEKHKVKGYYKYSKSNVNSNTTSAIFDTSNYASRWVSNYNSVQEIYLYNSNSFTKDDRTGESVRENFTHEFMASVDWSLTENITLLSGIYFNDSKSLITTTENAISDRASFYSSQYPNNNYQNNYEENADKQLRWNYDNKYFTFQIPIIFDFKFSEKFGLMLGLTRVFKDWDITSVTDVYFTAREVNDNGTIKNAQNFIERYTSPKDTYTEDFTNIFTKFNVAISKQLKVGLLVDPEFDHTFRIAQWWLSFDGEL